MKNLNQNFISSDSKTVINSYGEVYSVGDIVGHEGADVNESAIIYSFNVNSDTNDVMAFTTKGMARIDFLIKKSRPS